MTRDPFERDKETQSGDDEKFIDLLLELFVQHQSRYQDQAQKLLKDGLLIVTSGETVIKYWIDDKGSYFKFSQDSGATYSNSLSFFALSGSDEEKIQNLRDQFANSEARLKLGI